MLHIINNEDVEDNISLLKNSQLSVILISSLICAVFTPKDADLLERAIKAPFLSRLNVMHIFDSKFSIMLRYAGDETPSNFKDKEKKDYVWVDGYDLQKELHELISPDEIQKKYNVADIKIRTTKQLPAYARPHPEYLDIFLKRFPDMAYHMDILKKVEFK